MNKGFRNLKSIAIPDWSECTSEVETKHIFHGEYRACMVCMHGVALALFVDEGLKLQRLSHKLKIYFKHTHDHDQIIQSACMVSMLASWIRLT